MTYTESDWQTKYVEHAYALRCSERGCEEQFVHTLWLPNTGRTTVPVGGDTWVPEVLLYSTYGAAKNAGWTIRQDHDGTVHVSCPGRGNRLPEELLSP